MKTNILLCLFCGLLAACSTAPWSGAAPDPAAEQTPLNVAQPAPSAPAASAGMDALLAYQQGLRDLAPAEQTRELATLQTQPKSAQIALKKAMLLALSHNNGDLAQAQTLLDGVIKSTEPDALVLKPLARLLATNYAEMRRLGEQADKLAQQVKDSQRRIDQLNETLEALKVIERTLPARPSGAPAMPVTK